MELLGDRWQVDSAAFSPDGTKIVVSNVMGITGIWDVESGKGLKKLEGHEFTHRSLGFSPDGKKIATASDDHTARIWTLE